LSTALAQKGGSSIANVLPGFHPLSIWPGAGQPRLQGGPPQPLQATGSCAGPGANRDDKVALE